MSVDHFDHRISTTRHEEVEDSLNFASSSFVIVFYNHVVHRGNILRLLRTVSRVSSRRIGLVVMNDTSFNPSGEAPCMGTIIREISRLNGHITCVNCIPGSRLCQCLGSTSVRIIPSV